MATALSSDVLELRKKFADFANSIIADRPELNTSTEFPFDIWQHMGRENLLGLAVPEKFGGSGGDYLHIAVAGKAMVEYGYNLGIALSWLMHQITARFFLFENASPAHHELYLPGMATGQITACLAVSEPQGGGHPKYLRTSAEHSGDTYILNGEKTYLTNGPIAELFIVFAVIGHEGDRKLFNAFLLPKSCPGLVVTGPLDVGFLRPCPHGGIVLRECSVSDKDVLGKPGSAYIDMALPFRELEDALMMGPIVGGVRALMNILIRVMRQQGSRLREELDLSLGELESTIHALEILTYEAAMMLDSAHDHEQLPSLLIFCRRIAAQTQSKFDDIVSRAAIKTDIRYAQLAHDLKNTLRIAANVAQIKQKKLGRALF